MQEFLKDIFLAVITAAVPVLTAYIVVLIRRVGENAAANTESTKAQGYVKEITDAITDAVAYTSQTYVDALKKAGTFTKDAQEEAMQKAFDACLASISPAARAFAERTYGDFLTYLYNKIEAEVRKQKNEAPATLALPVVESTVPDTKAIAATCAAATAAAITQVALNQPGTGQTTTPEQTE